MGGKGVEPQLVAPRLPGGGGVGGGGVGCLKVPGGVGGGGGGFMIVAAWRSVSLIADGTFVVVALLGVSSTWSKELVACLGLREIPEVYSPRLLRASSLGPSLGRKCFVIKVAPSQFRFSLLACSWISRGMNCHFTAGNFSQVPEESAMARLSWMLVKLMVQWFEPRRLQKGVIIHCLGDNGEGDVVYLLPMIEHSVVVAKYRSCTNGEHHGQLILL